MSVFTHMCFVCVWACLILSKIYIYKYKKSTYSSWQYVSRPREWLNFKWPFNVRLLYKTHKNLINFIYNMTFLFLTSTKTPMICAPRLLCRDDDHQEKKAGCFILIYTYLGQKNTHTQIYRNRPTLYFVF